MHKPASSERLILPSGHAPTSASGLHPDRMTATERLTEIAKILAAGLQRLTARKSSGKSADFGESSLHIPPDQSGQARIVQLLVERVDVGLDAVDIRLRTEGLANLTAELGAVRPEGRRAA